jgi:predicted nucleic acid-binding protein
MSLYVDANVLVRLYLQLPGHRGILDQISARNARAAWPLPVTDLLRFEVTNAIHRMVFESRSGGQWRVSAESAALGLAEFSQHEEEGVFLKRSPLTLAELEPEFISMATRYTPKLGFRTYDMLHVASAVVLRAERFISLDAKANQLARLVGLATISGE